jgi:putative ABC transport system permease protein
MSWFTAESTATLRLARRDAWRNRGRSLLVALMIAIPVLSMSAVSVVYHSDKDEPRDNVIISLGEGEQVQARIRPADVALAQMIDGWNYIPRGGAPVGGPTGWQESGAWLSAHLPPGDRLLSDRTGATEGTFRHEGRALSTAAVREFDYRAAGPDGPIRQISGRSPQAATEVVITERLARADDLAVGDTLDRVTPTGTTRLSVVGVVGGLSVVKYSEVVALPGSLLPKTESRDRRPITWLVVGPAPVDWNHVLRLNERGFVVTSRAVVADPPPMAQVPYWDASGGYYDTSTSALDRLEMVTSLPTASTVGVITVATGLILLQVALLAGPAIAVGARRNERTLALLATMGGSRRHLRAVVLATSGVIGLVGSTIAAGFGVGIGVLAVQLLRRYAEAQIVRVEVHLLDLLALIAVGTVTAIAAAMIPARQAARLDVVAVLTQRRNRSSPLRRIPVIGVLVMLIGCAACYYGASHRAPFTTLAGIALAEIGLVVVIGSIIALVAQGAGRLPFAGRFALREASRQRGRTAPAVAAVMAAIAGSVAAGIYLQSGEANARNDYQPRSALGSVIYEFQPQQAKDESYTGVPEPIRAATTTTTAAVAAALRTLPVADIAIYQSIADPQVQLTLLLPDEGWQEDRFNPRAVDIYGGYVHVLGSGRSGFFDAGDALKIRTGVADPAIQAALREGRVVIFNPVWAWPDHTVHVQITESDPNGKRTVRVVKLPALLSNSRPGVAEPIFPPSTAEKLGVQIAPIGMIASTSRMPSEGEERAAEAAVDQVILSSANLERGYQRSFPIGLLALVVGAAVVTLGGTFTAIGLAAAESRTDVATLAAVGAGPALRRRLAAAQAAVITLLGGGLGLITGLLAGWALVRLRTPVDMYGDTERLWLGAYLDGWPFTVPWPTVAALVIGVPLLAISIAFLTTRSRLPLVRRLGQ